MLESDITGRKQMKQRKLYHAVAIDGLMSLMQHTIVKTIYP